MSNKELSFSEYLENAKTNKVEITEEKFVKACAEAVSLFDDVIKRNPSFTLLLGMYSAKIAEQIFHSEQNDESEG